MDEGDPDVKIDIGDFEDELRYQDPGLAPLPFLLEQREIGGKGHRSAVQQLEHWGEESLVQNKHSQLACQLPGAPKSTFLMVFSPDGTKVASTHGDHNIYVTDVKSGKCIYTLKGHPRTPWSVAFHPASNEIVASGCLDGQVRVWDLKGGSEVWTPEKKHVIASLAFHPTDQVLVIATDNELYFWDWFHPEPFAKISTGSDREKVKYVKFDPLGYKLITGIANVRNERHRHDTHQTSLSNNNGTVNNSARSSVPTMSTASQTFQTGWSGRAARYMDRYRARFSDRLSCVTSVRSQDTPSQDSQRTTGSDTSNLESTWRRNYPRSTSSLGSGSREGSVRDDDMQLGDIRHPFRPGSDDSASSSSVDSSSSVTSGISGTSHERNTRLSLLWTSRLNRAGNDSDNSAGGYDFEERRGEGNVMRADASSSLDQRGSPISRSDIREGESSRGNVRGRGEHRRCPFLSPRVGNDHGNEDNDDDIDDHASARQPLASNNIRSGGQGGSWMYYRGKFPWNVPHSRTRISRHSRTNDTSTLGSATTNSRSGPSNRRHAATTGSLNSLATPGPSGISQRTASNYTTALPFDSVPHTSQSPRLQNSSPLDPHFGVQLLSRHIENMQRICRSLSLPRAHFELTRHRHEITRLQQIRSMLYDIQHQIRSLRASVDQTISEEFPELTRDESLNSVNSTLPSLDPIRAELLSSSRPSVADQVELEVDIQTHNDGFSFSTLAEEDPDQILATRIDAAAVSTEATGNAETVDTVTLPPARNPTPACQSSSRISAALNRSNSSARHLARLHRTSSSRFRSRHASRNRLVWPWLLHRQPHRRRPTRSRLTLSSPIGSSDAAHPHNSSSVRSPVGRVVRQSLNDPRGTRSSRRLHNFSKSIDIGNSRSVRRSLSSSNSASLGGSSTQVRRYLGGTGQRRTRAFGISHREREPNDDGHTVSEIGSTNLTDQFAEPSSLPSISSTSQSKDVRNTCATNNSAAGTSRGSTSQSLLQIAQENSSGLPESFQEERMNSNISNELELSGAPTVSGAQGTSVTESAEEEAQRSFLEIQSQVDQLSETLCNSARDLLNVPPLGFYSEQTPSTSNLSGENTSRAFDNVGTLETQNRSQVLTDQRERHDTPENGFRASSFETSRSVSLDGYSNGESGIRRYRSNYSSSTGSNRGNYLEDDDDPSQPDRLVRARQPTSSLASRIAVMLAQEDPVQPPVGTATFDSGLPSRPFLQSLRSLRREIMNSHRARMLRRNNLVSGADLAGATLAAINPTLQMEREFQRETMREERRERYRQMLQMMADRLNRLMNRSLLRERDLLDGAFEPEDENELSVSMPQSTYLSNLRRRQTARMSDDQTGSVAGSSQGSLPNNGTNSAASYAIDNHMYNLRLLVRLALHLIYQLLNFICNQNISYEERPISRLPNPFREDADDPFQDTQTNAGDASEDPSSVDLDIEPGLHNLTSLLETVRMTSEELRNNTFGSLDQSAARRNSAGPSASLRQSSAWGTLRNNGLRLGNRPSEGGGVHGFLSQEPVGRNPLPHDGDEQLLQGEGTSVSAGNSTSSSYNPNRALRRRLTNFLIRTRGYVNRYDGGSETSVTGHSESQSRMNSSLLHSGNPLIQRPLPTNPSLQRSPSHRLPSDPLVIPRIILSDVSEESPSVQPPQNHDSDRLVASPSSAMPNEDLNFHLRTFGGIPLRFLGRQNAVDRRSPDSEDSSGTPPNGRAENGDDNALPSLTGDVPFSIGRHPFRPWAFPRSSGLNQPHQENLYLDRGQERVAESDHLMYFSRPFFSQYMAPRNISVSFYDPYSPLFAGASSPTHRIQAWDFSDFQIPDISDSYSNIIVPKCKIHFDASVSISDDGNMLAALIPENQPLTRVCVFSLETKTMGQILYSSIMDANTICVSISPTMKHLVVGIASYHTRLGIHHNDKQVVAGIYKLSDNLMYRERGQAGTLKYLRGVELQRDHRLVSLNCIRWMPFPGQGLIYGTNRGQLTILR